MYNIGFQYNKIIEIDYSSSAPFIKSGWLAGTEFSYLFLGENVEKIGTSAFYNCTTLKEVVSKNLTSIGNYAFYKCTALIEVDLPTSLTSIGSYAFSNCTGLTSITIPENVTSIGDGAFYKCKGEFIINSKSLIETNYTSTRYPRNTWLDGATITKFSFGNNVEKIGNYAFCGFGEMGGEITIPQNITQIGNGAFMYCPMQNVYIHENVTHIGSYAFASETIYCKASVPPTITSSSFNVGNQRPSRIYVPAASLAKYKAASGWDAYTSLIEGTQF